MSADVNASDDVVDPEVWDDVVRATLNAWLGRYFGACECAGGQPGARCAKHVEFLWRKRFKEDLVTLLCRCEPWLARADRLRLRDMMVDVLESHGYFCLLANTSSSKARVNFPDGSCHRVTGVALGICRRIGQNGKPILPEIITWPNASNGIAPADGGNNAKAHGSEPGGGGGSASGSAELDDRKPPAPSNGALADIDAAPLGSNDASTDDAIDDAACLSAQVRDGADRWSAPAASRPKPAAARPAARAPTARPPLPDYADDDIMGLPGLAPARSDTLNAADLLAAFDDDDEGGDLASDADDGADGGPVIAYRVPEKMRLKAKQPNGAPGAEHEPPRRPPAASQEATAPPSLVSTKRAATQAALSAARAAAAAAAALSTRRSAIGAADAQTRADAADATTDAAAGTGSASPEATPAAADVTGATNAPGAPAVDDASAPADDASSNPSNAPPAETRLRADASASAQRSASAQPSAGVTGPSDAAELGDDACRTQSLHSLSSLPSHGTVAPNAPLSASAPDSTANLGLAIPEDISSNILDALPDDLPRGVDGAPHPSGANDGLDVEEAEMDMVVDGHAGGQTELLTEIDALLHPRPSSNRGKMPVTAVRVPQKRRSTSELPRRHVKMRRSAREIEQDGHAPTFEWKQVECFQPGRSKPGITNGGKKVPWVPAVNPNATAKAPSATGRASAPLTAPPSLVPSTSSAALPPASTPAPTPVTAGRGTVPVPTTTHAAAAAVR